MIRMALALVLVAGVGTPLMRQQGGKPAEPAPGAAQPGAASRGDYLVHSVAMCVQCHSPRDERGDIIQGKEFTGAAMPVGAPYWHPDWALRAPALAGLPGFTDDQVISLLTTGHMDGRPAPMKPMPPFRMSREDAQAIVGYLRSR